MVGFCTMLTSILAPPPPECEPTVVILFDTKGPTFRDSLDPMYKANRAKAPEDMGPQFEIARQACAAFGWPVVSAPGMSCIYDDSRLAACLTTSLAQH